MTSHDPTEDQRIAAVVREHFTAHERSQEPAIMQNTVDTNTATVRELTPEQLIALSNDELFNIITPKRERERARALPRQRPLAVKLARRVGIVLAWVVLLVALAVIAGLAQVSVVLGQQALVADGVGPLAAAGVAAICSIVVGLGALAVLGELADRLAEIDP